MSFLIVKSDDKPFIGKLKLGMLLLLVVLIPVITINQFSSMMAPLRLASWVFPLISCIIAAIPLLWLRLWKSTRLSLLAAVLIFLLGDKAPGISSPVAMLITIPNFLYLLYLNRHSRIKKLLLPLFLLCGIYFLSAFALNFVGQTFEISKKYTLNIGWLGAFGATLIVYHMMYIPLAIYHLACTDKGFFRPFIFILSIVINVIAVVGLYQFVTVGLGDESVLFRVNSIMRLTTRLAPFLVASLPLFIFGLMQEKQKGRKIYWWISLVVNIFILLVTYTRGAIGLAGGLWLFLLVTIITARAYKMLALYLVNSVLLLFIFQFISHSLDINYFQRFEYSRVENAFEKRFDILEDYIDGVGLQTTSVARVVSNVLFGYGWFSERSMALRDTHNTFFSAYSSFGLIGLILYYIPYVWFTWIAFKGAFFNKNFRMRPQYGMSCAILIMFFVSGWVHNKLYSPIESAYTLLMIGILLHEDLPHLFPKEPPKKAIVALSRPTLICLNNR